MARLMKMVLPAHAGVILSRIVTFLLKTGITRTCGGDPDNVRIEYTKLEYYPHMRG